MRERRIQQLLWAVALMPVFFVAVLPDHVRTLVCRFGAVMNVESCCPSERADASETQARIQDEPWCSFRTVTLLKLPSERPTEGGSLRHCEPTLQGVTKSSPSVPNLVVRFAMRRSVAPPPLGPPIVLLKSSFLI